MAINEQGHPEQIPMEAWAPEGLSTEEAEKIALDAFFGAHLDPDQMRKDPTTKDFLAFDGARILADQPGLSQENTANTLRHVHSSGATLERGLDSESRQIRQDFDDFTGASKS